MDKLTQQLTTGKKINSSKDDPVIWAKSQQDSIGFKGLWRTNETLSGVATSVRSADIAMEDINADIEQMKASLDAIIKNYPPFPPGSQDRIRFLRMFNGLREQIDKLSAPEDDAGARQIMADTTAVPGNWTVPMNDQGASITIRKQDVSTGTFGLNIQGLAELATDAEIVAARASLETAQVTLRSKQAAMGTDAAAITNSQSYNTTISTTQQTDAEGFTIADMNDAAANYKSMELKNALALQSVSNMTNMHGQLLELLK